MVYVKLLKDVAEGGVEHKHGLAIKTVSKRNPAWWPSVVVNGELLRCPEPQAFVTPYLKGLIVDMHEASADKWVKRGLCEVVKGPA